MKKLNRSTVITTVSYGLKECYLSLKAYLCQTNILCVLVNNQ